LARIRKALIIYEERCELAEEDSDSEEVKCPRCGVEMESLGGVRFRTGPGIMRLLMSAGRNAPPIGPEEDILDLDVYACPHCRRVELFNHAPDRGFHKPEQNTDTPRSFLKVCVKCKKSIPVASEECPFCGAKQRH
jgi:uncharacterized paraquat-inducible protein A